MRRLVIATALALTAMSAQAETHRMGQSDALVSQVRALKAGQLDKAIRIGTRALQKSQMDSVAALLEANLCLAFHLKGDQDTAIAHCDQALELNPVSWQARLNRGNAYYAAGRYEMAVADYEKAMARVPGNDALAANLEMARAMLPAQIAAK